VIISLIAAFFVVAGFFAVRGFLKYRANKKAAAACAAARVSVEPLEGGDREGPPVQVERLTDATADVELGIMKKGSYLKKLSPPFDVCDTEVERRTAMGKDRRPHSTVGRPLPALPHQQNGAAPQNVTTTTL